MDPAVVVRHDIGVPYHRQQLYHIITSSHHHIITSSHHHIITSSHHHIITSSHITSSQQPSYITIQGCRIIASNCFCFYFGQLLSSLYFGFIFSVHCGFVVILFSFWSEATVFRFCFHFRELLLNFHFIFISS